MKNLCCMLCFFSFTIGSGCEPSLIEKVQRQIYYTQMMIFDEPDQVEYWKGQQDAFIMIFNEIALEYREHQ